MSALELHYSINTTSYREDLVTASLVCVSVCVPFMRKLSRNRNTVIFCFNNHNAYAVMQFEAIISYFLSSFPSSYIP
jgi:hypothetical protein